MAVCEWPFCFKITKALLVLITEAVDFTGTVWPLYSINVTACMCKKASLDGRCMPWNTLPHTLPYHTDVLRCIMCVPLSLQVCDDDNHHLGFMSLKSFVWFIHKGHQSCDVCCSNTVLIWFILKKICLRAVALGLFLKMPPKPGSIFYTDTDINIQRFTKIGTIFWYFGL